LISLASVEFDKVSKSFGKTEVISDMSLKIADRGLVVFVGPSGCGKSTLLRLIAGLEDATSGTLRIGDKVVNDVPAADRGIAMVFQSYALYPHMTVAENMGFALKMTGTPRPEVERKVREAAEILHLSDLLDRKPRQLSGGQRQRVAIGRAIVRNPDVFLFDEPLSNLDAGLRAQMRVEIARLHKDLKTTMIYVTHDQVEAMTLADRIILLNKGRVEQEGAPLDLYEKPANKFVAGFLGQPKMNFLDCIATHKSATQVELSVPKAQSARLGAFLTTDGFADQAPITLGVRPDAIGLMPKSAPGTLAGEITVVEQLGTTTLIYVKSPGLADLITVEVQGKAPHKAGEKVWLQPDLPRCHLFDQDGKRIAGVSSAD
jgi:ABC-type sugar transport system ATPase subunit